MKSWVDVDIEVDSPICEWCESELEEIGVDWYCAECDEYYDDGFVSYYAVATRCEECQQIVDSIDWRVQPDGTSDDCQTCQEELARRKQMALLARRYNLVFGTIPRSIKDFWLGI